VTRIAPPNSRPAYFQLWKIVDGCVRECFAFHPDYIPKNRKERTIRNSINKRIVGAVLGYAAEVAKVRSGQGPAGEKTEALATGASSGTECVVPRAGRPHAPGLSHEGEA
jgi:hypothetical protein